MSGFDLLPDQARRLREDIEARRRGEEAEKATKNFREFFLRGWHVVEPARPLVLGWHIDAICDHLQAVSAGHIKRLLVTVPPGHCKSISVSVMWPAWQWLERPQWRSIATSYSEALATRDSVRCRAVLDSPWFQQTFKPKWGWSSDQNIKTWFENTERGSRISLGVGGSATGIRADAIAVDDPLNAKDQYSASVLESCVFWWDQVMSSRLNDMANGVKIIIMQRLSESDLAAHVLRNGGYQHLNLMSEFEPERRAKTFILQGGLEVPFWEDPRKEPGELMFPDLFPKEVIDQAKIDLTPTGFASQHQQRPSPAEGGILKRHWWRYWGNAKDGWPPVTARLPDNSQIQIPIAILPEMDELCQSWDLAFKDAKTSDYVVGQLWGRRGANKFLLMQVRKRMGITETIQAIRQMTKDAPKAVLKLVEDKANGPAVISMLRDEIPGIVAVNPEGGKVVRAQAIAPQIESGNVFLPHPHSAPWVADYIERCASFPHGQFDDEIDATSQALARWGSHAGHYGLVEFLKQSHEEDQMKAKQESALRALAGKIPGAKQAIATSDEQVKCDRCGSVGVTFQPGQGFRCGDCGLQWAQPTKRFMGPKRGAPVQKLLPGRR